MTYSINNNQLVQSLIPYNQNHPIHVAWLESVTNPNQWINNNLNWFIGGSTFSYYNPLTTYTLGQNVNGGLYYSNNGVYQMISSTWSYPYGAVLTTVITGYGTGGHSYQIGDYVKLIPYGTSNVQYNCLIKVNSVSNPTGFAINITGVSFGRIVSSSLSTGGSGWVVGMTFQVVYGYSLATGVVDSISGFGVVVTYHITYEGTGYYTGISSCVAQYTEVGTIKTYSIIENGWGYTIGLCNAVAVTGIGSGGSIEVLTVGGTPPPDDNYTNIWYKIVDNFIGVDERSLYTSNKITMEWNLNRYYNTTFRQPTGLTAYGTHSDIYINNNVVTTTTFFAGGARYGSAFCRGANNCTAFLSPLFGSFYNNVNYTVYVPELIAVTVQGGSSSIASYVNKYNYLGTTFNIQTY